MPESFESGIVLHRRVGARTIRPDGLAGLFAPSTQMIGHANLLSRRPKSSWRNLECVIFNAAAAATSWRRSSAATVCATPSAWRGASKTRWASNSRAPSTQHCYDGVESAYCMSAQHGLMSSATESSRMHLIESLIALNRPRGRRLAAPLRILRTALRLRRRACRSF